LAVIANPWHALDAEGRPSAHVQMLGTDGIVGGSLDHEATKLDGVHVFTFREDVVTLRAQGAREWGFYVSQIRDGALIAADAPTAALAGVAYADPKKALAGARDAASAAFEAETGRLPDWATTTAPDDGAETKQ
jgi:hypothetical protein